MIVGILDESSIWVSEEQDISRVAVNYFSNLLQTSNSDKETIGRTLDGMCSKIPKANRREMDRPFTKAEIEFVIKKI